MEIHFAFHSIPIRPTIRWYVAPLAGMTKSSNYSLLTYYYRTKQQEKEDEEAVATMAMMEMMTETYRGRSLDQPAATEQGG